MFQFLASQMDCPPPRFPFVERWLRRLSDRKARRLQQQLLATLDARALYDIGASDIFVIRQASPLAAQNPYVLAVEIEMARMFDCRD